MVIEVNEVVKKNLCVVFLGDCWIIWIIGLKVCDCIGFIFDVIEFFVGEFLVIVFLFGIFLKGFLVNWGFFVFFGFLGFLGFDIDFLIGFLVMGGFFLWIWGFLVFFFGKILEDVGLLEVGGFLVFVCFLVIISDIFFLVFFNMVMVCKYICC